MKISQKPTPFSPLTSPEPGLASPLTAKGNVVVIMADDDEADKDEAYLRTFLTTIPMELPAP